MNEDKKKFTLDEKLVADRVADEILTVEDDKENHQYFLLILLFLCCLIFLVSTLSFAIFDTYYNGGSGNVIDVDVVVDNEPDPNPNPESEPGFESDRANNNGSSSIQSSHFGSILFSFNEGSNYINMTNVFPTADSVGKTLTGDKEYFDFSVSALLNDNRKGKLVYEISLIPIAGNTIDEKDVRVYLTENSSDVSISSDMVNTYGNLPTSNYHTDGKVIYRKVVNDKFYGNYVFRMWLSRDAKVDKTSKKFGCKVVVDAYYR